MKIFIFRTSVPGWWPSAAPIRRWKHSCTRRILSSACETLQSSWCTSMGPDIRSAPLEPQILSSTNTSAQKTEPDVAPTVEGLECSFIYRGTMLVHRLSPSNLPSFSSQFSLPLRTVFITMATDHARTLYTVMYRIQFSFFFFIFAALNVPHFIYLCFYFSTAGLYGQHYT